MPDQFEQYYKYLKANGADVAPDFNSFKNTLSDYNNASKYYSYLKENQFDVPANYESFADTFGLKKKDGGIVSSPTELPLQGFNQKQIDLLKKGVEKPIQSLSQKKSSGLVVPTNLPKQEALAYENELKLNDVAVNTLTDIYKKKGLKFDPSRPAAKKQIQEYVDKSINGDLTKVAGKDGKEYLVRSQGFLESAGDSFVRSLKDPIESTEINFTDSPEELANLLDEKIRREPNVPEEAPSAVSGYLGGLAGGLPKMAAILAIPYVGQTAMVGEMYYNALANQRRELYQRGLEEGMDRVSAAKKAMEIAPVSAIPDALVAAVMAKGVGGKSAGGIIPNAAKESFIKAAGNALKSVGLVSATGGFAGYERSKIQQRAGYKVTDAEAIENGFREAGDYAIMDAAFKVAHIGPKYLSSAAKNVLSTVPKEVLNVVAEKYPDGQRTLDEIPKFVETKAKVQDFVPEEKLASVTGLTEKTDNIKSEIKDLEEKKKAVTPAIEKEIDLEIAEKNKEVDFYDNQIKKVIKSKDQTGISEEVDDVTGLKSGEQIVPKEFKVTEEVKPAEEEISVYHGGGIKDLSSAEGGLFVSADKGQAEAYAKGNQGQVQEFKLNKNDISNENNVREIINELGLKSKEEGWDLNDLMLHEIIDPRFETSLSESDLNKLFKELDKRGYKAIEMMATDVSGKQRNVNDILVLNPKETLKGVRPTEVKSVEQLREQEQSELDSRIANAEQYRVNGKVDRAKLTNEEDIKAFDEVYDKYDKLISPLLEKPKQEARPIEAKISEKVKPKERVKSSEKEIEKNENSITKDYYKTFPVGKDGKIKDGSILINTDIKNGKSIFRIEFKRKGKVITSPQTVSEIKKWAESKGLEFTGTTKEELRETIDFKLPFGKKEAASVKEKVTIAEKPKEEKTFAQKDLDRAEAKRIHGKVAEMDPPSDAEQVALRYLAEGGKVSQDAINEVSGTTKRASLNTGRRELKTGEAKARDYAGGTESLDDLAHRLWEASGQEISEIDIKDALMSEIGNNNTRLEASKAYLERYNIEYQEEQYYERFIEEDKEQHAKIQEELERDLRKPLEEEIEGMSSEEHINNLIKQYEAETKRENKQLGPEGEGEAAEEISSRDTGKKAPEEAELAKEYKEAVNKASKKAKENAKKDFVDRNFENLVEKLKIQIKCPT